MEVAKFDDAGQCPVLIKNGPVRRFPASLGPADITLEAPSDPSSDRTASCHAACKVHLVEGSGSELSGEVQSLLRSRLRSAALLTFVAFAVFLVWHVFSLDLALTAPAIGQMPSSLIPHFFDSFARRSLSRSPRRNCSMRW